jgi:hypothetical protein
VRLDPQTARYHPTLKEKYPLWTPLKRKEKPRQARENLCGPVSSLLRNFGLPGDGTGRLLDIEQEIRDKSINQR